MKSIFEFKKNIAILFTDIDDTLTLNGKLIPESYSALWRLQKNNIDVIPITGRPAGWCEMIARFWPVKGVIGENGAFYFAYQNNKMNRVFFDDSEIPETNQKKLKKIEQKILSQVPGSAVASDQFCRMFDLAIDICEDVKPLPPIQVEKIVTLFQNEGATAKVSSIHVNGWFGDFNKLKMALTLLKQEYLLTNPEKIHQQCAFVGDSPNDEPMFEFFENSFAVNNVTKFMSRLKHHPKFISQHEGGLGFKEVADHLIAQK